jgi:hypothetical protein
LNWCHYNLAADPRIACLNGVNVTCEATAELTRRFAHLKAKTARDVAWNNCDLAYLRWYERWRAATLGGAGGDRGDLGKLSPGTGALGAGAAGSDAAGSEAEVEVSEAAAEVEGSEAAGSESAVGDMGDNAFVFFMEHDVEWTG